MKRVALEQLPQEIAELFVFAQHERVVITRDGQPYALIVGVENKDEEDLEALKEDLGTLLQEACG